MAKCGLCENFRTKALIGGYEYYLSCAVRTNKVINTLFDEHECEEFTKEECINRKDN